MITLYRSEGSASLRRIPLWLVGSNGTSPATGEAGGQPQIYWVARNTLAATGATLSLVSANAGEYFVELSASEVSQVGLAEVQYRSATALPNATYFQIANFDSSDSVRLGLFALPNAAAEASGGLITVGTGAGQLNVSAGSVGLLAASHSGATIQGLSNYANISNVTLHAGTHSAVTIQGVTRVNSNVTPADALYSAVTVRVDPIAYSGLTVQGISNYANISNVTLHAGTHSDVTLQGVTRVNSAVTIANATYSGVTVGINNIAPATYSAVTVGSSASLIAGGIVAASFAASAIDAAALATDGINEIADGLLNRNMATGSDSGSSAVRTPRDAFRALRNRVASDATQLYVYAEDDTTVKWTASLSTVDSTNAHISGLDPNA